MAVTRFVILFLLTNYFVTSNNFTFLLVSDDGKFFLYTLSVEPGRFAILLICYRSVMLRQCVFTITHLNATKCFPMSFPY